MDIRAREDELFSEWRKKYDSFVRDGAPNPEAFERAPVRTVIVLKDINASDVEGEFDLRRQLAENPHKWWKTVARWCAALSRVSDSSSQSELAWSELKKAPRRESLEPFALIQLKKSPGAGTVSSRTLAKYAQGDAKEIASQLAIYEPEVIIGAGSKVASHLAAYVFNGADWHRTRRGVRYTPVAFPDGRRAYLIDYLHPSARVKKSVVCYGLLDAFREVVEMHGLGRDN